MRLLPVKQLRTIFRRVLCGLLVWASIVSAAAADGPAALIGTVQKLDPAGSLLVEVIRKESGSTESGEEGTFLFAGDQVRTGANTRVELLFLENFATEEKKVFLDGDSQVEIRTEASLAILLGRLFAQLRGRFDVYMREWRLGAIGTEFQIDTAPETASNLLVLEGNVALENTKGSGLEPKIPGNEEAANESRLPAQPVIRSIPAQPGQALPPLRVRSGEKTQQLQRITVTNTCGTPDIFKVDRATSLTWVQLSAEISLHLEAGETGVFYLDTQVNATGIAPGEYVAESRIECAGCAEEPECQGEWEEPLRFTIQVEPAFQVGPLERLKLEGETLRSADATPAQEVAVRSAVDWTNEMILEGRPDFPNSSSLPWFSSPAERESEFVESRMLALWNHDPEAYETLGEIYCDWGEGARSIATLNEAAKLNPALFDRAWFLTKLGQGYRLAGQLDQAEEILKRALSADPESQIAYNEMGNLYLEQGRRQLESRNSELVRDLLQEASSAFARAAELPPQKVDPAASQVVLLTNQGKLQLTLAEIALEEEKPTESRTHVGTAISIFRTARSVHPDYTPASLGLGKGYEQLGTVAAAEGDSAAARQAFQDSERIYTAILQSTHAAAAAWEGLGSLYEQRGPEYRDKAVSSYQKAIRAQPKRILPFQRLSLLLREQSPQLAENYGKVGREMDPSEKSEAEARVPDLIGLQLEKARSELARREIVVGKTTYRASQAPKDQVLSQSPEPDAPLKAGGTIDLWLAGPAVPTPVPDVEGLPRDAAVRKLEEAGFAVGKVTEKKSSKPPESVHDQDPEPGKKRLLGSPVDLEIAVRTEPGKVRVPDVEGIARETAVKSLRKSGFVIGKVKEKESRKERGMVLDQDPEPGKERRPGSRVDLEIAVPKRIKVPNLSGEELSKAQRGLTDKGLVVGRIIEQRSCDSPGRILNQDPKPGTPLYVGERVDLIVSGAGGDPVTVPHLNRMDLARAQDMLRALGLRIGQVESRETDQAPEGTILAQKPEAGTALPRGCPVDLLVAKAAPLVPVPQLIGLQASEVESLLHRSGLRVGRVLQQPAETTAGRILDQSPPPGQPVREGTPVDIVVSVPAEVVVPNLFGLTVRQAQATLEKSTGGRLSLGSVSYQQTTQHRSGTVIRQSPEEDSRVRAGTRVNILVAQAPAQQPTVVPDVRGMSSDAARKRVEAAGLRIRFMNSGEYVNDCRNRRRIRGCQDQNPQPGTQVSRGAVIQVWLIIG